MLNSNTQKTLDAIYPVGSIYLSVTLDTADKVAAALGGTWSKFTNDAYLKIVSSGAGSSGGNTDHKITTNQMPSHTHTFTGNTSSHRHKLWSNTDGASNIRGLGYSWVRYVGGPDNSGDNGADWYDRSGEANQQLVSDTSITPSGTNSNTGGGNAYYPGYIGVYVYQRTA